MRAVGNARLLGRQGIAAHKVFPLRYGLKMLRVNAVRSLAKMIQNQTFWNLATPQFVGDTMRTLVSFVYAHPTVTLTIHRAEPEPALVRLGNVI